MEKKKIGTASVLPVVCIWRSGSLLYARLNHGSILPCNLLGWIDPEDEAVHGSFVWYSIMEAVTTAM